MALERKPVPQAGDPGYPSSDEYNSDRRGFLALVGAAAAGVVGFVAYKALTRSATNTTPVAPPLGGVKPVPAAVPVAQPAIAVPGEAPVCTPELVHPQAQALGKSAVQPQPPVQPEAQPAGGIRAPEPPAQPQAQVDGDVKVVPPPARPAAPSRGDVAAPEPPAQPEAPVPGNKRPVAPDIKAKGGAGRIVRPSRGPHSA